MLLHQLFEHTTLQTPDKVALVFEGTRLTYADVDRLANQLAASLQPNEFYNKGELNAKATISGELTIYKN